MQRSAPSQLDGEQASCRDLQIAGNMRTGAFLLLALCVGPTAAQDVVLTRAEAQVLKNIVSRDRFMQQLRGALPGLDALHGLPWREVDGPVGMALTWERAAIADWRRANAALAKVGLHGICDDIQLQIVANSTNRALFEQLSAARACGD